MFYQVYLVIAGMKLTILVLIVTDYIYIVILPHMVPATTTQSTKGKPCYDNPEYQGQTLLQQPRVPRAIPATTAQSTKGKPCYDSPEYQGQTTYPNIWQTLSQKSYQLIHFTTDWKQSHKLKCW